MDDFLPVQHVGVADIAVVATRHLLISSALGSCVGVALYDRITRVGSLAHIMLPSRVRPDGDYPPGKFVDTAIPTAVEEMRLAGAMPTRLVAKIVGGAEMFVDSATIGVGERNVLAVKNILRKSGIRVVAADTGGHHARTIQFDTGTGVLTVRSVSFGVKEL